MFNNFILHMRTRVVFGKGTISQLSKEVPENAKVMVTYGGGSVFKNGVMEQVRNALDGFEVIEFGGIEPNPGYETCMKAVKICKEENVDFLLAVGGGSVIDGTKFISNAAKYEGDNPWNILLTRGKCCTGGIPVGVVLTLPATGSEMNAGAVITKYDTQDKLDFDSEYSRPIFAILDPETTYSLPQRQTINGIIDAFVHVAEQYLTYPVNAKIQDRFAEGIMLTLIEESKNVLENPQNYEARANIMWSATMALNNLIGAGVPQDWVSHFMGHELTAMFGIDHGMTLAVVLPSLLEYTKTDKLEKLAQYGKRVWGVDEKDKSVCADKAIKATRNFFEQLGAPTRLSAYELDEKVIPALVDKLKEHNFYNMGERKTLNPEDMEKIYKMCI